MLVSPRAPQEGWGFGLLSVLAGGARDGRYKILPARLLCSASGTKFSLLMHFGQKQPFIRALGGFCTGKGVRRWLWGEFCTGMGVRRWLLGEFCTGIGV